MAFFLRASNKVVETEADIDDWKVIFHGDSLEDVEGFFLIQIEDKENKTDMWNWKHVEILDENGKQLAYYFQHKWLPSNDWFRLKPTYEKLVPYVKPKNIEQKKFNPAEYLKLAG